MFCAYLIGLIPLHVVFSMRTLKTFPLQFVRLFVGARPCCCMYVHIRCTMFGLDFGRGPQVVVCCSIPM